MVKKSMVSTSSSDDEISQQYPEELLSLSSSDEGKGEGEGNGISYWEFINPSDADSDIVDIDIDNLSLDSIENGLFVSSMHSPLSSSIAIPQINQTQEDTHHSDTSLDLDQQHLAYVGYQYRDDDDDKAEDEGIDHDDGDGDGYGYDLDDELVPLSVSGKLGRQRMRKLGKRGFARMYNSKKSPFLYTKPGCVHGKHGLGLKHSF